MERWLASERWSAPERWLASERNTRICAVLGALTIAFLLSDLSRGITGELVHVDGGYHAIGASLARAPTGTREAGDVSDGAQ